MHEFQKYKHQTEVSSKLDKFGIVFRIPGRVSRRRQRVPFFDAAAAAPTCGLLVVEQQQRQSPLVLPAEGGQQLLVTAPPTILGTFIKDSDHHRVTGTGVANATQTIDGIVVDTGSTRSI